jgi:ferritin-like metal-binding protein YciE
MESARQLFEHLARSMYDATKRMERDIAKWAADVSDSQLTTSVQDLHSDVGEQRKRLEEIFELLDQKPATEESATIKAMLAEVSTLKKQRPGKEVFDAFAGSSAGDITQYSMDTFETMLQLAERSGVTTAAPKIGDNLQVSMKEHKKLHKDFKKLNEQLLQRLRPS